MACIKESVVGVAVVDSYPNYVSVRAKQMDFDDVCAIAYDHGYVPRGIINSTHNTDGSSTYAARFKPRSEVNSAALCPRSQTERRT